MNREVKYVDKENESWGVWEKHLHHHSSNLMSTEEVARRIAGHILTDGTLQTKMSGQEILYDLQTSCVAFLQGYKLALFVLVLHGIHLQVHLWEHHFSIPTTHSCKQKRWGVPRLLCSQHLDMQRVGLVITANHLHRRRRLQCSEAWANVCNEHIIYYMVAEAWKGMLVERAALCKHHQTFYIHFKNIHSEWIYDYTLDRVNDSERCKTLPSW